MIFPRKIEKSKENIIIKEIGKIMSEGINFNPRNGQQARLLNTQMQPAKAAIVPDVLQNVQQAAIKQTNEFITQSAKSLYQFFANFQSAQMKGNEMSMILKDFLNMQKDIETFLATMSNNTTAQQLTKADIAKLLMSTQMDLSKLTAFMQQNGKEALSKLFTMTANFSQSGAVARSSQMSEIIAILNACTPNSETSQTQVLKNMMLLYLPWLPLGEQNFTIEIGTSGGKEEGEAGEDSITVLISTVNYGNVQVLIFKGENSTINFNIYAGEIFPKEKVISQLKAEARDYNVQTSMVFEKKENLEKSVKTKSTETKVSVNTGKHVNPFLILMAQTAVRIIIETDKNASLIETRKEKL